MTCRGICSYSEYRLSKQTSGSGPLGEPSVHKKAGIGPYSVEGVMYCILCETYFQTHGKFNRCPCCHEMMRKASRKSNKALRSKREEVVNRIS